MIQPTLFDELQARDQVLDAFERTRGPWLEKMRAVARRIATERGTVCSDDLREVMAKHPEMEPEGSRNCMGSVFRGSEWEAVGWKHSEVPGSHGNRLIVWRLVR